MSLAEYRDAVLAWNAVQDGDTAILSPGDEQEISDLLDKVEFP